MNDKEDMLDFLNHLEKEVGSMETESDKKKAKSRLEEAMIVYSGDDRMVSSLDLAEELKSEPPEEKYLTGIDGIDLILDGLRENQLIVLAAPTKAGKTQFCVELTTRMKDLLPSWFPFEESAKELIRKFLDRDEEPPLFYTPKEITGNTVAWLEKRIVEAKVKHGSKLFFIDHLHFIIPFSSDRMDTRIGQTMRDLKTIAREHSVIIVLVAHLKKTKLDASPDLEDLRDSSFIAQEADTVMMLWRETKRQNNEIVITNNTTVSIQANRRTGKTGTVKLEFKDGRYLETDWMTDASGICHSCGQIIEDFDG